MSAVCNSMQRCGLAGYIHSEQQMEDLVFLKTLQRALIAGTIQCRGSLPECKKTDVCIQS